MNNQTEAGFLEALAVDPTDETTRLVYADWLEDHQDPRAAPYRTFLECRTHLQKTLAETPENGWETEPRLLQAQQLYQAQLNALITTLFSEQLLRDFHIGEKPLKYDVNGYDESYIVLRGGLPVMISLTPMLAKRHQTELSQYHFADVRLFSINPECGETYPERNLLSDVHVERFDDTDIRDVLESPLIQKARRLLLGTHFDERLDSDQYENGIHSLLRIVEAIHTDNLRHLALRCNVVRLGMEGDGFEHPDAAANSLLQRISSIPACQKLRSLRIEGNRTTKVDAILTLVKKIKTLHALLCEFPGTGDYLDIVDSLKNITPGNALRLLFDTAADTANEHWTTGSKKQIIVTGIHKKYREIMGQLPEHDRPLE